MIVAIGLVTLFFLSIWPEEEAWALWDGSLVKSSDTAANWIMTLLSGVAAVFL